MFLADQALAQRDFSQALHCLRQMSPGASLSKSIFSRLSQKGRLSELSYKTCVSTVLDYDTDVESFIQGEDLRVPRLNIITACDKVSVRHFHWPAATRLDIQRDLSSVFMTVGDADTQRTPEVDLRAP